MTDGVSLNVNGLVLKSAAEVDSAFKAGKISKEQANSFKAMFAATAPDPEKGTTVQANPDNQELTPEQKAKKDQARQAELDEVAAAKKHVQEQGVTTDRGVITSHGDGTTYTFDIKAPTTHLKETTKDAERARMARYYDEKSGEWIERGDKYKTNKEVRQALKAKEKEIKAEAKQAKKDAKRLNKDAKVVREVYAKYDAEMEKIMASGLTLEQILQDPKYDELVSKWGSARAQYNALESKSMEATDKHMKAKEEYDQVHQAKIASGRTGFLKNTGVGADKRAYNAIVKANNRLVDRIVVRTEAEKDRIKDLPEYKDKKIKVASDDDIQVLKNLSVKAREYMDKASDPKEKSVWQELANLTTKTEDGSIYFTANTKQVQDALIDLTGGDMRLNYTEQKMISKETGMSMSKVRHAFRTYAFEAPNPIGKRFVNGLVAAGPVVASMGLGYLLSKNKSHAEAHAEDTQTAHASADATQTTVVSGEVTAEVPGKKYHWDFPDGSEYNEVIAGKSETEYYEAVATATAHAEATATANAKADAVCTAVATLSPASLIAAPALAFLAGFAKRPAEISATYAGITTEKMAKFESVYKGNKNENIGNQIVQMAGHITGDKAIDRALIVAVLDHDIGSQNTTPTTTELRNALAHLDAIKTEVDKFKKLPPKPEKEPEKPQDDQTVQETPCKDTAWIEPDHCDPIKIPRNKNGVAPIGNYVLRRGYLGPDGKPVTDEKTLNKIQRELKRREGTPQGIQRDPKDSTKLSLPLDLEIDGVIYHFDCEHGLDTIKNSKEFSQMHSTRGLAYKEPKRSGQVKTGKLMGDLCEGGVQEITQEQYDEINSKKTKK